MDLKPLFEPRTMAVFGVSASNYRHPANEIFNKNLLRYPGLRCKPQGRNHQWPADPQEYLGSARAD